MSFFQFQNPECFLLLCYYHSSPGGRDAWARKLQCVFPASQLVKAVSRSRRSLPGEVLFGLRILALAALITALARPQMGKMNDTTDADGIDIVVTLDLSGSMRALDLSTRENVVTRLDAAKKVVRAFIDKRPYDRIALVAFAADAYVVSPLTLNHDWLKEESRPSRTRRNRRWRHRHRHRPGRQRESPARPRSAQPHRHSINRWRKQLRHHFSDRCS